MIKNCPHCGEAIPINADICRYCKKPVKRGTPATRTGNVLKILAAIVIALVIFYAILANFYYPVFTGGTKVACQPWNLILQPLELATSQGIWIPAIIEYGGSLLAIILYVVGDKLETGKWLSFLS
jgi:hypothetical protein